MRGRERPVGGLSLSQIFSVEVQSPRTTEATAFYDRHQAGDNGAADGGAG